MFFAEVSLFDIIAAPIHRFVTDCLEWVSYRGTKLITDDLVAGRESFEKLIGGEFLSHRVARLCVSGAGGDPGHLPAGWNPLRDALFRRSQQTATPVLTHKNQQPVFPSLC
jgi:hypothetical protein